MSGSSRASRTFSRCIVTLDAGVSISWAPDPDGSYEHGAAHHREEESAFARRLTRAAPELEVLFDQLEEQGHVFGAADSLHSQRGAAGLMELCEVELCCTPPLSETAMADLAQQVARLVNVPT